MEISWRKWLSRISSVACVLRYLSSLNDLPWVCVGDCNINQLSGDDKWDGADYSSAWFKDFRIPNISMLRLLNIEEIIILLCLRIARGISIYT